MEYFRCENADCGFVTDNAQLDVCPDCGAMLFPVEESDLLGNEWTELGNQALDRDDPALAAQRFQRAADLNDPYGMTNLGWCYEVGQGVERDAERAVQYYRKAAELGYHPALCNLGI